MDEIIKQPKEQGKNRAYSRKQGYACNFSEKGQKMAESAKYLKIFGVKNAQICKDFEKRLQNHMHETTRISPKKWSFTFL